MNPHAINRADATLGHYCLMFYVPYYMNRIFAIYPLYICLSNESIFAYYALVDMDANVWKCMYGAV